MKFFKQWTTQVVLNVEGPCIVCGCQYHYFSYEIMS